SGRLDDRPGLIERLHPHVVALRKKAAKLGERWLDDGVEAAKDAFDPRRLETVQLADELQVKWKARLEGYEARGKSLEDRAEAVRKTIEEPGRNTFERIESFRRAARDVQSLLTDSQLLRAELPQVAAAAREDYRRLEEARRRDQQAIQNTLELFTFDADRISKALVGPELAARLARIVEWVEWGREQASALSSTLTPERSRGLDVAFAHTGRTPGFLAEELTLGGFVSIEGREVPFQGVLTGLTSDPVLYGRPAVLRLNADSDLQLQAVVEFDHTGPEETYEVTAEATIPQRLALRMGRPEELALDVSAARTVWRTHLRLAAGRLEGQLTLTCDDVAVTATSDDPQRAIVAQAAGDVLAGLERLEATMDVSGTPGSPQWELRSNLGDQLAVGLEAVAIRRVEDARRELAARVDEIGRERLGEFQSLLNGGFQRIGERLNVSEAAARRVSTRVGAGGLNLRGMLK
ncbi:MAG: hypothetical protein KY476_04585, partial [Planctomycetes bacterium]|nr:hypothetical protein [Planctomycetota bacterium]